MNINDIEKEFKEKFYYSGEFLSTSHEVVHAYPYPKKIWEFFEDRFKELITEEKKKAVTDFSIWCAEKGIEFMPIYSIGTSLENKDFEYTINIYLKEL